MAGGASRSVPPRAAGFLQSRQRRPLTRYFPEILAGLVGQLQPGTVLDGVIWGRERVVHHVADRLLSLPPSSLWTVYLWSVYDEPGPGSD
jgi:hypothetical protein